MSIAAVRHLDLRHVPFPVVLLQVLLARPRFEERCRRCLPCRVQLAELEGPKGDEKGTVVSASIGASPPRRSSAEMDRFSPFLLQYRPV